MSTRRRRKKEKRRRPTKVIDNDRLTVIVGCVILNMFPSDFLVSKWAQLMENYTQQGGTDEEDGEEDSSKVCLVHSQKIR